MRSSTYQGLEELSYSQGATLAVHLDLITAFLQHAQAKPNLTAIITSDTTWSYHELLSDVLGWKHCFHSLKKQRPVVICLHRTPRLISILLALQWLEIPYIPIELHTPLERIRAIIEDSKAQLFLHDTAQHESFVSLSCNIRTLRELDQNVSPSDQCDKEVLNTVKNIDPHSAAIAYIIYTSGTTGEPKGVRVSRAALNNFLASMGHFFLHEKDSVLLATTTTSFDISALELYLPIWQQKTLFLANDTEHKDAQSIQMILNTYAINLLQGTPSFWSMLHYSGWKGKKDLVALCGGEPLTKPIKQQLLPKVSCLWNMYGPTEATIWCSLKRITSTSSITIGYPIHNMSMCVLDNDLQVLPKGKKGELYIGGVGLAKDYINKHSLTRERFITCKSTGYRLYRTGDVASMTNTGEMIIFGRVDNQIKLRGYRIELEDIEAHIQTYPAIRNCAVGVHQEQLIAYVCVQEHDKYTEQGLCNHLANRLLDFMIPNRFIYLEQLPLSPSGKIDRKALPLPQKESRVESSNVTPLQKTIMEIWCEILDVPTICLDDNFFQLGGHSLIAARVVAQIHKKLQKKVNVSDIYQAPSVKEFSELVITAVKVNTTARNMQEKVYSAWLPLIDFQFLAWVSNLFSRDVRKLNVVGRQRIAGPLNIGILNDALQVVIENHDSFFYHIGKFIPMQRRKHRKPIKCIELSLVNKDNHDAEYFLKQSLQDLSVYTAWSRRKPLINVKLFHLSGQRVELQVAMPHISADQQSLEIFFRDLSHAYLSLVNGSNIDNLVERHTFKSYIHHECNTIRPSLRADEQFWRDYLQDASLLHIPKQYIITKPRKNGHTYSSFFPISDIQLSKWRSICVAHAVTLNEYLCAALGLSLIRCSNGIMKVPDSLFINTVKSTREDPYYDEVIGCFLRTQPVKLDFVDSKNITSLAQQIQRAEIETAAHQHASSLIKLASIGRVNYKEKKLLPFLITLFSQLCGNSRKGPYFLHKSILKACKRLAGINRGQQFLLNVNIWNNFFVNRQGMPNSLFGKTCQPVPLQQADIFTIDGVLDVCLMRDGSQNTPFLVISANLTPEFRTRLGKTLLNILEDRETNLREVYNMQ